MTASARETQLLKTACQILEEAGRPLSVRRILRAGEQDDRFEGQPDLETLREALLAGVSEGLVVQARRGIFTLASGDAEPAVAKTEPAPAPAKGEAPRRRRRRESPPAGSADTPKTLEEAAALSVGTDRDALKGKLWSRLQRKASQVTDQPTADAEAPADPAEAKAESDPPAAEEAPKGRRRRRRRESGEKRARGGEPRTAEEKPRRRRRRPDADAAAVEANPAPVADEAQAVAAPAADAADPRAKLKARLAGRSRPTAKVAAAQADTPAPPAKPAQADAPASDATDARSLLKRRLAARAGTETEAPTATEPKPAEEAAEAPRARSRRRRREPESGGARAALKARISARAAGESATTTDDTAATPPDKAGSAVTEAGASGGGSARARLKARLAARAGSETEAPAAAPAKAAEGPAEADAARDALKSRLAARTRGSRRPAKASTEAKPAPKAAPAAKGEAADPRSALKARLAGRRGTEPAGAAPEQQAEAPATQAAASKAPAPSADPRAALKARLGARRGADPLEVPLAESRRPYREKRKEEVAPKAERRSATLAEVSPTSALVAAALDALRGSGAPLTIDALTDAVDGAAEGGSVGLRAALRAENGRRELAGLRPLFVAHYGGSVGLTEWGLSERYSALEARIQEALAEQQELVRRDLLARVGDLADAGFEQVIVMLLEQLGHRGVKVVHRQAGTVALTVSRGAEGGGTEKIAVVARRSWGPIKQGTVRRLRDTLAHFEADSGLVMTIGTFAASARSEARQDGLAHVRLIDGAGLAGLLYEHGIGLSSHRPVMRHLDVAFFASL